jgi:osmoprotectant transport system ATP-binding protein
MPGDRMIARGSSIVLSLRAVSKSFGATAAVSSFSLEVPAGKTTVLIGPSGCGKSTVLRLIIGLIRPDSGTIEFEGRPVSPEAIPGMRRKMGYVIQEGGLFPHLTARANITLMASHIKWPHPKIEARLTELADLTQFPRDGLGRYPGQLSGGQRQRVSLMRALMLDPDLLLMDEPLGALDPLIRVDVQAELKSIFSKLHKTVVMVTHDLGEAAYLGDTIVLMSEGRLVQEGALRQLVESPRDEFVTRFVKAQRSPLGGAMGEAR